MPETLMAVLMGTAAVLPYAVHVSGTRQARYGCCGTERGWCPWRSISIDTSSSRAACASSRSRCAWPATAVQYPVRRSGSPSLFSSSLLSLLPASSIVPHQRQGGSFSVLRQTVRNRGNGSDRAGADGRNGFHPQLFWRGDSACSTPGTRSANCSMKRIYSRLGASVLPQMMRLSTTSKSHSARRTNVPVRCLYGGRNPASRSPVARFQTGYTASCCASV